MRNAPAKNEMNGWKINPRRRKCVCLWKKRENFVSVSVHKCYSASISFAIYKCVCICSYEHVVGIGKCRFVLLWVCLVMPGDKNEHRKWIEINWISDGNLCFFYLCCHLPSSAISSNLNIPMQMDADISFLLNFVASDFLCSSFGEFLVENAI